MSDTRGHRPEATRTDIEGRAVDFLQRKRFWNWDENDQSELEAWLQQSVMHRVAFLRLEAGQSRIERLVVLRPAKQADSARSWRDRIIPIALTTIALLIIALLGTGANYFFAPRQQTYATVVGGQKILKLADGSRIELNTDTVLRMSNGSRQREIWLVSGEAYFQIVHNQERPFVVHVGQHRVVDLGTKFFIRCDKSLTKVTLMEGKARLDVEGAGKHARSVLLEPGDVAIVNGTKMSLTKRPSKELTNELSWRRGVLILNRTTLADAAAEFNRYNPEKLVVADSATAQLTMSGAFPTNDTQAFSDAVREIFKLHVERRGSDTVISR